MDKLSATLGALGGNMYRTQNTAPADPHDAAAHRGPARAGRTYAV